MVTLEHVEKLRERADVSYEEAKALLEETNDDILEALVRLENDGKIKKEAQGAYTSAGSEANGMTNGNPNAVDQPVMNPANGYYQQKPKGEGKFKKTLKNILNFGNHNSIAMCRNDETVLEVPLTIFVILLICFFWVVLPFMVISLFFRFYYEFHGKEIEKTGANDVMDKVSKAADNIKQEFTEKTEKTEKE